ncbi:MAG: UDP-N-acetylglucosamine 2-epimerase (non-hydrolyzing) [Candidatus Latescibacteria bacterium]|nr:UDP-N-acetylglucosamine 2-epimerase (non-hydrolyzing) [Candidatus Latescibacterota bacterium]
MKLLVVAGARPNFVKVAPILAEFKRDPDRFQPKFVHTGQHYDDRMSKSFLDDLGLGEPDIALGVGSGSHAVQTARVMEGFERVVLDEQPGLVIVVGDVNSTMACTLVCAKLWVPVAHVEAGLRSFDRRMPEEINRIVTDALADLLLTSSPEARDHLRHEGISDEKIHFVGNVMIDSLVRCWPLIEQSPILDDLGLQPHAYTLLTLHRPSNVDTDAPLRDIFRALAVIGHRLPIVFPVHPRTQKMIEQLQLTGALTAIPQLQYVEPLRYFDFIKLESQSRLVLTDSGGVQEETTFLDVPCLTLRENTERPITVTQGTSTLVGSNGDAIIREATRILDGQGKRGTRPEYWDGHTAERIVAVLKRVVGG